MRRSTLILLLVFGLLVIFAWLFTRYKANKADGSPTETPFPTAEKVYNLTNLQVSAVNIANNEGKQVDLYRDESTSNNWAIKDYPIEQADNVRIETVISQLLAIQIIDRMAENPPLDAIGLATPAYTITMDTTDGQQIITQVGTKTPIGTGYYIRTGSGPIVIVDNITLDDILNFIQNPPLVATPTPETTATEAGTPIAPGNNGTPTP